MGLPDLLELTVYTSKESLKDLYLNSSANDPDVQAEWELMDSNYADFVKTYIFAISNHTNQSSCGGDSGGPYFVEKNNVIYLYGVHGGAFPHSQKGTAGCYNNYVQFFAPVGPSIDWIQNQLKAW